MIIKVLKNTLSTALLFLAVTGTAGGRVARANPSEVDLALEAVGTGSLAEVSQRLFATSVTVLGPQHREQAIAALPRKIRENRITQGTLFRRVTDVMSQVAGAHNRGEDVELFLYKGNTPGGMLLNGCLLVLSDATARLLRDEELSGIIAHELGHRYFMDKALGAMKEDDEVTMRGTELAADAVAMMSLSLMGHDPDLYISAIRKIETMKKDLGQVVLRHGRSHPTAAQRATFARRLIELYDLEQN